MGVVVGAAVVVAGADAAAWAGTITLLTSGLVHFEGIMMVARTPPMSTVRITCRRSNFLSSLSIMAPRFCPKNFDKCITNL
ncbi:exported protein of unknown function [Hyphomicrobium sp. MC1]|nr:exported protein of unknown function [Hyphomicrobium sp. MC1]